MNMKARIFVRLFAILFTITAIANVEATERIDFRRLISYTNTSSSSMMGSAVGETIYYYSPENQAMLDSLVIDYTDFFGDQFHSVISCESTINDLTETISVCTEFWDGQNRQKRRTNIIDVYGRFIQTTLESWSDTQEQYTTQTEFFRHYNAMGFEDSLHVIRDQHNSPPLHYYLKRLYNGNQLESTILYQRFDQNWVPVRKYTFSYPQSPQVLDCFIRFDALQSQQELLDTLEFEQFCNPNVIPASILNEYWYNNAWHTGTSYDISQYVQDDHIFLTRQSNDPENMSSYSSTLKSSFDGSIVSYHYSWSGNEEAGSSHYSFIWDIPLGVEDDLAPETPTIISLYPNPFTDKLNMSVKRKYDHAVLSIYNLKGQLVRELNSTQQSNIVWDGRDSNNKTVSNGIYLVKLTIGSERFSVKTLKMR